MTRDKISNTRLHVFPSPDEKVSRCFDLSYIYASK